MSANLICRSVCGVHSAHVTGVAEEVRVQRVALRAGLVGELLAALLQETARGGGGGAERERESDKAPGMLLEEGSCSRMKGRIAGVRTSHW